MSAHLTGYSTLRVYFWRLYSIRVRRASKNALIMPTSYQTTRPSVIVPATMQTAMGSGRSPEGRSHTASTTVTIADIASGTPRFLARATFASAGPYFNVFRRRMSDSPMAESMTHSGFTRMPPLTLAVHL